MEIASDSDTGFTILRFAIGTDSTVEARAYEGTVVATLFNLDIAIDSINDNAFPEYVDSTGKRLYLHLLEKILLTNQGKLVFQGAFTPDDIDEKTDWVDWNKTRDNIK